MRYAGLLKDQRIICREKGGSCWVMISEAEKKQLENCDADIKIVRESDSYQERIDNGDDSC